MLHSKKGSAIIIVLIISMIAMALTLFAIGVSKKIVQSSNLLMDKLRADLGAVSVLEKTKFYASTGRFYPYYIKNKNCCNFPKKLYIDGRSQKIDNSTITLQDTGGLINVWVPNTKLIGNILSKYKDNISQSNINIIKDSILDWYDKDAFKHLNGAEKQYYQVKGYKYSPRNFSGVQSIYELHLIRGLTNKKAFGCIKKYLVISPKWNINIDTVSSVMLSAMFGISKSTALSLEKLKDEKGILKLSDITRTTGISPDPQMYKTFPTFILDIDEKFRFNKTMKHVHCEIDFRSDNTTPYRVLKWSN